MKQVKPILFGVAVGAFAVACGNEAPSGGSAADPATGIGPMAPMAPGGTDPMGQGNAPAAPGAEPTPQMAIPAPPDGVPVDPALPMQPAAVPVDPAVPAPVDPAVPAPVDPAVPDPNVTPPVTPEPVTPVMPPVDPGNPAPGMMPAAPTPAVPTPAVPDTRPNVILVMTDDMSHNAHSYYNPDGPQQTPNLDALAEQSVRLTDFHVSPTCSPTRAALMTGRYSDVTGVWHTIRGRATLRADEITMADVFKANGYATGMFFKWHLGDNYPFRPKDRGFDHVAWTLGGGIGQIGDYWGNTNQSATAYVDDVPVKMVDEDDGIEGAFSTNFFFNRAMEFIDVNIEAKKPFFAYIPTSTAHHPQVMPPDARGGVNAMQGTVENIDKNMGNLVRFLDERGIADNTILIYTTDNGGLREFEAGGAWRLNGTKSAHTDGGHRVPCFVRWPGGGVGGEGAGRDVDPLINHIDWLPTFMDILGFEDVQGRPAKLRMHGMSFKNFLVDEDPSNDPGPEYRNRIVPVDNMRTDNLQKFNGISMMMDGWDGNTITNKWRLVRDGGGAAWRLYDILEDPGQGTNIINQNHGAPVAMMEQAYENYWAEATENDTGYTRIILGHEAEPVSKLSGQEFFDQTCWNHSHVARGGCNPGTIAVEFSEAGSYRFDLRRWPKEVEDQSSLTTAPRGDVYAGVTPQATAVRGGGIRIWNGNNEYVNVQQDANADDDGIVITVDEIPAGPAFIQAWLNVGGNRGAVYYNYVSRAQ